MGLCEEVKLETSHSPLPHILAVVQALLDFQLSQSHMSGETVYPNKTDF